MRALAACAVAVRVLARVVLTACRVVLVVVLRFLQPVLVGPFVVGCIGGVCTMIGFAVLQMWGDAVRAGVVTLACGLVLGVYSSIVLAIGVEPVPLAYRLIPTDEGG